MYALDWRHTFHDLTYGNCYTYNDEIATRELSNRTGEHYGLQFVSHANPDDYLDTSDTVGLRIVFHKPGVRPFPDNEGNNIVPGYINTFGLSFKKIELLPSPYGSCVSNKSEVDYYFYDGGYSVPGCKNSFTQMGIVAECNCSNPKWPAPNQTVTCTAATKDIECIKRVGDYNSTDIVIEMEKQCNRPCKMEDFSIIPMIVKRRLTKDKTFTDKELRGMGKVYAYMRTLTTIRVTETARMTIPKLLSNFGGILGFFMGASMISIFELACSTVPGIMKLSKKAK